MEEQFGKNVVFKAEGKGIGNEVMKFIGKEKEYWEGRHCIITINIIDMNLIPRPEPEKE